ncbi:hypothetical protein Tco_0389002 [Tanacetum coccineum]
MTSPPHHHHSSTLQAPPSPPSTPAVESFVNSSEMLENDKSRLDKGYHAVPLPLIGNCMAPKPDLIFRDEHVESESLDVVSNVTSSDELKHEFIDKGVFNTVKSNAVRMNNFSSSIIEDWNSDDEILTRSGKLKTAGAAVNTVRTVNTADPRPVNTVVSKPTLNCPRPISNAFKRGHSQVTRERAVVSENKGIRANAVKDSACWVWKAKHSSALTTFKKYSYIDARGRFKSIMAWIPKRA